MELLINLLLIVFSSSYTITSYNHYPDYRNIREDVVFNTENYKLYNKTIQKASKLHDIDPNLIRAIIIVESKFRDFSESSKGAVGLMQLMPVTAKSVGVTDRRDPNQSIHGGSRYIKRLLKRFESTELALAAYNAGPTKVREYGGIPPYEETIAYVNKVLDIYTRLENEDVIVDYG